MCDRFLLCQLVSGRDQSSRGQGAIGSKGWIALAIISSVSAGHGAGWWWKTPSWCIWTETTAGSTLCCCSTRSSKWKWAALTQTPDMESASRTSLGRSAVCLPTRSQLRSMIYARGYFVFVMHAWSACCSGVWSSSAAATDRLIGGAMKSTGLQKLVTSSKFNALTDLHHHVRTFSPNGKK